MPKHSKPEILDSEEVQALLAKRTLRVQAVAALLDLHPNTIRRWIDEAKLTAIRQPGGQLRIRTESVKALL